MQIIAQILLFVVWCVLEDKTNVDLHHHGSVSDRHLICKPATQMQKWEKKKNILYEQLMHVSQSTVCVCTLCFQCAVLAVQTV